MHIGAVDKARSDGAHLGAVEGHTGTVRTLALLTYNERI